MILEEHLVPFVPSATPPGPWIIFAPHPDDETLGMGGTIAIGVKEKKQIHVVFITDGSMGGDPYVRKMEAIRALSLLGVTSYTFLNIPDRKVYDCASDLAEKAWLETQKVCPNCVFLPSPMEFHPDHRATTAIVLKTLCDKMSKVAVWFYEISRQSEINVLVDITSTVGLKKKAISCYSSQLLQNDYLEIALSLNRLRAYTLAPQGIRWCEGFWRGEVCTAMKTLEERLRLYTRS